MILWESYSWHMAKEFQEVIPMNNKTNRGNQNQTQNGNQNQNQNQNQNGNQNRSGNDCTK